MSNQQLKMTVTKDFLLNISAFYRNTKESYIYQIQDTRVLSFAEFLGVADKDYTSTNCHILVVEKTNPKRNQYYLTATSVDGLVEFFPTEFDDSMINKTHLPCSCYAESNFDNRYSIYIADPYEYLEPEFSLIQKLAEDLGAVNPVLVRGGHQTNLTADKFLNVQKQLDEAFDKKDFLIEEVVNENETVYLIEVNHDSFFHGYPKSLWKEQEAKQWLTPESSGNSDCWMEVAFNKVEESN